MNESAPFLIGDQLLIMDDQQQTIVNRLGHMEQSGFVEHFWRTDGRLWKRAEDDPAITATMGWLHVAETMKARIGELESFANEIFTAGFERAVLAGMGGSSLAPLVLSDVLYQKGVGIPVEVLDSTDPATVLRIQRGGDLSETLFVIASKSGSTAEPTAFDEYFFDQVSKVKANAGENFVAITDPGSDLEKTAHARGFRRTFLNFADIGGRFSALSYFGMVPAALMRLDLEKLLDKAIQVCTENQGKKISECPAFVLGVAMGEHAAFGSNKLTFIMPPAIASLGLWLEQLIAESTGKESKGILPVAGEEPASPLEYGRDRVFAYLRPRDGDCTYLDARIAAVRDKEWPIIQIALHEDYDIAREFMRWEIATAVAGSILGINPFDQPNVQEAKDVTKKIIAEVEQRGSLPPETPSSVAEGLQFYGNTSGQTAEENVLAILKRAKTGDFFTLMAYVTETPEISHLLAKLQGHIRDCTYCATTKGFGPRFLHSTGQFHKGGPNQGHFIQLTQDDREDAPLPGRSYTFGTFRDAQAKGDRETLERKGRDVTRIHLGSNPEHGVKLLLQAVKSNPTVPVS